VKRNILYLSSIVFLVVIFAVNGGNLAVIWQPFPLLVLTVCPLLILLAIHPWRLVINSIFCGFDRDGEVRRDSLSIVFALSSVLLSLMAIRTMAELESIGKPLVLILVTIVYTGLASVFLMTIKTEKEPANSNLNVYIISGIGSALSIIALFSTLNVLLK
jgi:hypothetical protein